MAKQGLCDFFVNGLHIYVIFVNFFVERCFLVPYGHYVMLRIGGIPDVS